MEIVYQNTSVTVTYWAHLDEVDINFYSDRYEGFKGLEFKFLKRMGMISFVNNKNFNFIIKKINKIRLIENIEGF
jgi:hypothetical protein